jgi:hypothetical protein
MTNDDDTDSPYDTDRDNEVFTYCLKVSILLSATHLRTQSGVGLYKLGS